MRISACVWLLCCSLAHADEVDTLIDSIKSNYHGGRYQQALTELNKAEEKIIEVRLALYAATIPDAIAGWQQEEIQNEFEQYGILGSVQKRFVQANKKIDYIIGPDQNLLAATLNLSGKPTDSVKGAPAIVFFDTQKNQGQVGITPNTQLIVVVKGEGVTRKELLEMASNLKMDVLANIK